MAARSLYYLFFVLFISAGCGQLITPYQSCQMKCIQDINHYVTPESKPLFQQGCQQYCQLHAYDDLLAQMGGQTIL